jgi:hypothetical protein
MFQNRCSNFLIRFACALSSILLILDVVVLPAASQTKQTHAIQLSIVDADSSQPLAARVYLTGADGTPHYFQSTEGGTAVRYEKQNWANQRSVEYHTTVSAHPCVAEVSAGTYELIIECGKSYFPFAGKVEVGEADLEKQVKLKRWNLPAERRWYSGDLHIHRDLDELKNIVLAEDLNVVFPLTNWVTISDRLPAAGDKSTAAVLPNELIRVDDTHVIWPRNTEYEIFQVGTQRHTLGALFVLGHPAALTKTVPPWKPVIESARQANSQVLFDMDKLDWPFAMLLPTIAPDATYELANNHVWRTEFALRNWNVPAPGFLQPPFGGAGGNARQWIEYTLGMYYTLLDCGFQLPPSAGTANGVHPVPAGFGRVYVHLPDGFDYEAWVKNLQAGRSFVTTGPMLYATASEQDPGFHFSLEHEATIILEMEIISETPLTFGEVIVNSRPEILLRAQNERTESGAYRSVIQQPISVWESGWIAVRFWEDRPDGQVRYVHSAPWYVTIDEQNVRPREEEKDYLVSRMQSEIERSRGIVSKEALAEYDTATNYYRSLTVRDDSEEVSRIARPLVNDADRERWLHNMIVDHRFSAQELRNATGMTYAAATAELQKWSPQIATAIAESAKQPKIKILPFPGGRHPRRGFLDGAVEPQRETKVSVFAPWAEGGYVVVDVPEAIFSNLGLTYLAHTHIPTIFSAREQQLQPLEWIVESDRVMKFERELPNGIAFGSRIELDQANSVAMEMWLKNGTQEKLTGLRSQVCVMLSAAVGFQTQRRREEFVDGSFVAVRADTGDRWIITSWTPNNRAWTNPPVPCIHSDPIFSDCEPGETVKVNGRLWFYEGTDIQGEIQRLAK